MKKLLAGSLFALCLFALTTGCDSGGTRSTVEDAEADAIADYQAQVEAEVNAGNAAEEEAAPAEE